MTNTDSPDNQANAELDKIFARVMSRPVALSDDKQVITTSEMRQIRLLLAQEANKVAEAGLKSGFYAGQAMAGVELEDCHKNWKKWNNK